MCPLFMAESNYRRLWSSERPIQQLGSYQMVSEPSPSTASMAPEGIAPLKVPLKEFSADLGTIIASIRHDFSRINSSLDRSIDHLKGSRSTVVSESHHEDIVYQQLHVFDNSMKETDNHGVQSENMSSSSSIDSHEPAVDTQFDSWVKILQEPQSKSTIASTVGNQVDDVYVQDWAMEEAFVIPGSAIMCSDYSLQEIDDKAILGPGNLSCQGMEITAGQLALDAGLRGVMFTDIIGTEQAKLELQEVVDFLMSPDKCTELEAKIPQDCLLHPACFTQQLHELDDDILHGFMTAIQQTYGDKDLIPFEDFAMHNAFHLLAKYGTSHLVFNDGIQGKPYVVLTSTFLLDLKSACVVFVEMPHKVISSHMHIGLLSFLVHELRAAIFRRRPPPEPPPNLFTQSQPMMEMHLCFAEKFLLCKILTGWPMFARIHMNCSYYSKHNLSFIYGNFVVHMTCLRDCPLPKLDFGCSLATIIYFCWEVHTVLQIQS